MHKKNLSIVVCLLFQSLIFIGKNPCKLCSFVKENKFNKVEQLIVREIEKRKFGTEVINPTGGSYITFNTELDEIVDWLQEKECVKEVLWDKCQMKIDIYPGWSSIGVIYKIDTQEAELRYDIQEGKTRAIRVPGFRVSLKSKDELVYLGASECNGFVK